MHHSPAPQRGFPPAPRGYPARPSVQAQPPGRPTPPAPRPAAGPDKRPSGPPEQAAPVASPRHEGDDLEADLAPRSGKIGDFLEGNGQYRLRAGWRILMVDYPADEAFVRAGLGIPEGYVSVIVGGMFTNKSGGPIQSAPVSSLYLLDAHGGVHAPARAVLESHPGFREGEVFDEETVAGHVFYLIGKDLGVQGIQWQSGGDVLTWLR